MLGIPGVVVPEGDHTGAREFCNINNLLRSQNPVEISGGLREQMLTTLVLSLQLLQIFRIARMFGFKRGEYL